MAILENGAGFTIETDACGVRIFKDTSQPDVYLQGEEASLFLAEYDDLKKDYGIPGTRAYRMRWRDILNEMCGCYFD